ncbi:MAG: FG-GAP-like repeat-containing protein [Candidatus Marinimicrobia bacterium]|nr:FG-GAP-like repeat-containing protein [Candidatus Neomarinimicrobiota bacterium]
MRQYILSALMILSSINLDAEPEFHLLGTMTGTEEYDNYYELCHTDDINSDGYDDWVIGGEGHVDVYFGGANLDTIRDLRLIPPLVPANTFGACVYSDDWNGDGYPDLAVGQPTWSGDTPDGIYSGGKVWVYWGGPVMDAIPDLELVVADLDAFTGWYYYFGSAITSGDLNGDGYQDLVASAPWDDIDARGRVYIYWGGPDMDDAWDVELEGTEGSQLGASLAGEGDINQDSCDELLIGAPYSQLSEAGIAYLVNGGQDINLSNSAIFEGDSGRPNLGFGIVSANLGDINNDGINDFGISTHYCPVRSPIITIG